MFDISKNKRDRKAEEQGKWMPWQGGSSFLVARNNNSGYKAFINKVLRDNSAVLENADELAIADQISDQALIEGVARHLLVDWKGVTDGGKAIKYSANVAIAILEEHDDLARAISTFATSRDNYLVKVDDKDAANLKK